jgi:hypothetical protein
VCRRLDATEDTRLDQARIAAVLSVKSEIADSPTVEISDSLCLVSYYFPNDIRCLAIATFVRLEYSRAA